MDFTEYMEELKDASRPIRAARLPRLSALKDEQRDQLAAAWSSIGVRRRRRVVNDLVDVAEDNVELDFDAVFVIGLSDDDASVRLESVRGLWENESPDLVEPLVLLMTDDPDASVRAEAALALGRFVILFELGRLRESYFKRVEAGLRQAIENADEVEEVRARAIEAMGANDSAWVRQAVTEAYESGEHRLKVSAVHAMGRSCEARWLPLLVRELNSDEAELRYEAALAIGTVGDESAVPNLVPLVEDEDDQVREAAMAALGEIGGEMARRALMDMLDSSSKATRDAAAAALAEIDFEEDPLGFKFR